MHHAVTLPRDPRRRNTPRVTNSEKRTNRPGLDVMVRFQERVAPFLAGFVLAALVPREPPEVGSWQKTVRVYYLLWDGLLLRPGVP